MGLKGAMCSAEPHMQELGLTGSFTFYPFTSRKQELGMKGHHVAGLLLPQVKPAYFHSGGPRQSCNFSSLLRYFMFTMLLGKESKVFFLLCFFASWFVSPVMAQQVKVLPPSLPTSSIPGAQGQRENNSHKLPFDLHKCSHSRSQIMM